MTPIDFGDLRSKVRGAYVLFAISCLNLIFELRSKSVLLQSERTEEYWDKV